MKRIVVLVLCMLMMLAVACSTPSTPSPTQPAEKPSAKPAETAGTSDEPIVINLFGVPTTIPETDPVIPELESRLGIELNIESTGGDESLLVARLAGGDIPDVFRVTTISNLSAYYKDGVLLNLKDYMDEMPNVRDMFTEQQWARVTFNGGIYGIPRRPEENYNCWYIRKDWLDALGKEDPATFDELLDIAVAMSKADLDGNGKNDTYAISGTYGPAVSTFGRGAFEGFWTAYGVTNPETIMIKDNAAVLSVTLPEFRKSIEEIRRFVEAGVVDPEIIANNSDSLLEKMATGKAGIAYGAWSNYNKIEQIKTLTSVFPDAEWVPMRKQITTEYGVSGATKSASGNDAVYAINADLVDQPEKLDAVFNMFNYMATEEGDLLLSFGIEGEHYEIDSNGTVKKLEKMNELTYGWGIQFLGRPDMLYCMTKFDNCADVIEYAANEVKVYYHYGQLVEQPEGINVSDIESYILEQVSQFIYGTRSMNEWDSFIDTLYSAYSVQTYVDAANETLKELGYIK
ncbi:MAG TPA: extracellular solute-binding protein [Clostridiales bacterium]|nr:extracellular solute-binding protein [Clostridiales bacterium]